jgi:putative addiction module CopG family antidote
MKISISLPDEDLQFVDAQASSGQFSSRSAVLQAAVRILRDRQHADSYAAAWDEWDASDDGTIWDAATSDGIR